VNIAPTEFNRRLGDLLRNAVAADESYVQGKAAFWRFIGIGILAFGLGAAVSLILFGYSYITARSDNMSLLSSVFSSALSQVQLQASGEGSVHLDPHEISLAKGQTVSFDRNSRLVLDPAAKIQVSGEIQVQTLSISAPQNAPVRTAARIPQITNFTVFKRVPFADGVVMTGWVFLTSTQKSPTSQYCYYTLNGETSGLDVIFDIAEDQKIEAPKTAPKGFDMLSAFNRCVWFKG
jgi:hypothetical protein